jgi:hypothetical protein
MSNRPIIAEVVGGLGNQLFIYAAALEQARRLNVEVWLDLSWFDLQDKRGFSLDQFFDSLLYVPSSGESFPLPSLSKFFSSLRKASVFQEENHYFQEEMFSIPEGTRIRGYFQSTKYFPSVRGLMARAVREAQVTRKELEVIEDIRSHPFNAIHVRRGDYFYDAATAAYHGITTREYFEVGARLLGNPDLPCLVFSDSEDLVRTELDGIRNLVFDPRLSDLGEVATLKLMSCAEGLVTSNSSFSWWAAFTLNHFAPAATVVTPRPWSKDIFFNTELIDNRWINLGL